MVLLVRIERRSDLGRRNAREHGLHAHGATQHMQVAHLGHLLALQLGQHAIDERCVDVGLLEQPLAQRHGRRHRSAVRRRAASRGDYQCVASESTRSLITDLAVDLIAALPRKDRATERAHAAEGVSGDRP